MIIIIITTTTTTTILSSSFSLLIFVTPSEKTKTQENGSLVIADSLFTLSSFKLVAPS